MLPLADLFRLMDPTLRPVTVTRGATRLDWPVRLDVYQRDDALHLSADLPGVNSDDVTVDAEPGVLHIHAERRCEPDPTDRVVLAERPYGTFRRSIAVGPRYDTNAVTARLHNGVLTVTVPVIDGAQRRSIPIEHTTDEPGTTDQTGPAAG